MLIRIAVWPIAMVIWTLAGFYVWVPAIVIGGTVYVASVFAAAFVDAHEFMASVEDSFKEAVLAYPNGFRSIHEALFRKELSIEGRSDGALGLGSFLFIAAICLVIATIFWWAFVTIFD